MTIGIYDYRNQLCRNLRANPKIAGDRHRITVD